jgi:hypothetical protein
MMVAAFVSILHFLLHVRVFYWFRNAMPDSVQENARKYAVFVTTTNFLESIVWLIGIFVVPLDNRYRWIVFVLGILLGFKVPKAYLSNDFHGMYSFIQNLIFVEWFILL